MVDRLRAYLDRLLDPNAARAAVVLAAAIFAGVAALVVLGRAGEAPSALPPRAAMQRSRPTEPPSPVGLDAPRSAPPPGRRQDPQDEAGSAAARSAARELSSHRALQHVPYRRGALSIEIVGAERGHAVLRVSAPSIAAAREGWRQFLRRYRDRGDAYRVHFATTGARRGALGTLRRPTAAVASSVASLGASPGALPVAITSRRRGVDRRRSGDCGSAILPTSRRHIEVCT
jgi:hypothetical protein